MKELGVQMIPAYSPQARSRSERSFGTWQGRLAQELRLAGISTVKAANRFVSEHHIDVFNRKFAVAPEQKASAFWRSRRSLSTPPWESRLRREAPTFPPRGRLRFAGADEEARRLTPA